MTTGLIQITNATVSQPDRARAPFPEPVMTIVIGQATAGLVIREFSLPIVREIPPAPTPVGSAW